MNGDLSSININFDYSASIMYTPGSDTDRFANIIMMPSNQDFDWGLFVYHQSFQMRRNVHLLGIVVPGIYRKLKLAGWNWLGLGSVSVLSKSSWLALSHIISEEL